VGLDTSHECWHGSYGSFAMWRRGLATAAGYLLDENGRDYVLPWEMFEPENYQGEWKSPPGDDPLLYLLAHSDCDGVIHPEHGVHIAARLEQLLPSLTGLGYLGRDDAWMREKTEQFIAGLREAARAGEDVDFH
jgi:hypothetical protein